ncbi:galectin-9 [Latimeria chalumnae]|nr:PREDICTED: galectin-9 [Latimeria chalumnae]|eukprot:XP_005987530.2 PREDICTED: galectin-9 [Latimeria chalumnae]
MAYPVPSQAPFNKPPIPFTGAIHGGLQPGTMITVTGMVPVSSDRFQVDFQCGSSKHPRADVAFHFNPRFDFFGGYIVCNTLQNQIWGVEERKQEMPFSNGGTFQIMFLAQNDSFMVAVNGQHLLSYKHKIPLSRVDTIGINGQVQVESISFQNSFASPVPASGWPSAPLYSANSFQPAMLPSGPLYPANAAFLSAPLTQSFTVPYATSIPGGLYPGKMIMIYGRIPPNPTRFQINLKYPSGIAFHLSPRSDENAVVRNSFINQTWGKEERSLLGNQMPLSSNQAFTICILCESHGFKTSVNGQYLFDFQHRWQQLQQIDQLEIKDNVTLTSVQV